IPPLAVLLQTVSPKCRMFEQFSVRTLFLRCSDKKSLLLLNVHAVRYVLQMHKGLSVVLNQLLSLGSTFGYSRTTWVFTYVSTTDVVLTSVLSNSLNFMQTRYQTGMLFE